MYQQNTRRGQTQKDVVVKNKNSHSVLDTESSTHLVTQLPRQAWNILNQVQDDLIMVLVKGFTLIELLVAIMIIGILAAVAVPQYQKAVMKSRFAAMMPIAKTLANANEVYYAEHDEYSTDPAKLNVTPQAGTPDGTAINMYSNPEEVSFVRVENPGVPNARYVVYQKLSENFPETTWCEAGDTRTEELCVALGGTLPDGLTGNSSGDNTNYKAYLLTGQARSGDKFAEPVCLGAVCDENGNITECDSGETLNNGSCEDCASAFPGAAECSTTSYAATSCGTGYKLNGSTCEEIHKMTASEAQAMADEKCRNASYGCIGIPNDDGTVSVCEKRYASVDEETGECVGSEDGYYEYVYGADGKKVQVFYCTSGGTNVTRNMKCAHPSMYTYYPDGSYDYKSGYCKNVAMTKDFMCSDGEYSSLETSSYDLYGKATSYYGCDVSTAANGDCTTYKKMNTYTNEYDDNNTLRYQLTNYCPSASIDKKACKNNNYQPNMVYVYNENGKTVAGIGCQGSAISADGVCAYGWVQYIYNSNGGLQETQNCTSYDTINWQTGTCS